MIKFFSTGKQEEVEISQDFKNIEVESDNADILLLPSTASSSRVELLNSNNNYKLSAKVKGNTLEIEVGQKWLSLFSFNFFGKTPTIQVYLPEKTFGTIQAETDNGTIQVSGISSKKLVAETDNGEVIFNDLKVQSLLAESDNGDLLFENIEGKIVGESSNGDISYKVETLNQSIEFENDNGSIFVETAKEPKNVTIEADTDNGELTIFGKANSSTTFGNGEATVKLTSDNGDIVVEK